MSSEVVVARHTVSTSPFCLDRGPPGRQYRRNNFLHSCSVKGKTIPRMWLISVSIPHGLPSIISHRLSKQLLAVRHRLLKSLQCIDHQFYQQCVIECGIPIHGHLYDGMRWFFSSRNIVIMICRSGRHRSVANAELWSNTLTHCSRHQHFVSLLHLSELDFFGVQLSQSFPKSLRSSPS